MKIDESTSTASGSAGSPPHPARDSASDASRTTRSSDVRLEPPRVEDGVELWRIARDSRVLDVNSRYSYLLWCRDFSATSVVARRDSAVLGFVTGYRRPDSPEVFMVWQVAVDSAARGLGLGGRMLDAVFDRVRASDGRVRRLETTITPDNAASVALFSGFARRHDAAIETSELFTGEQLSADPDHPHEPETLYRIGPVPATPRRPS